MTNDPTPTAREDEWIVVRCQLGERAAFDELIERWSGPLAEYLRRVAGDDEASRELAQEVWLRVLRGLDRLRDGSKLRGWLFGIARRALMDRWRRRYATPPFRDLEEADLSLPDADEGLEAELANLETELRRLPFPDREVLTLFYLRELTLAEVAEVLAVPGGTVKSRLFRARQRLRAELESPQTTQRRPR